eukprot:sb/3477355/
MKRVFCLSSGDSSRRCERGYLEPATQIIEETEPIVIIEIPVTFGYGAPSHSPPSLTKRSARNNMRLRETAQEDRRKRGYHTQLQPQQQQKWENAKSGKIAVDDDVGAI